MHIPDGFLDLKTCVVTAAASAAAVGYAMRRVRTDATEAQMPVMALTAAFVFAAQMINFPIIGGTSGHLLGSALATILLGPWAATLVMTVVLVIQCLVFMDGGITALGANVLNMAVAGVLISYLVYKGLGGIGGGRKKALLSTFAASWMSVAAGAALCALELAASGTVRLGIALGAMLFWHSFIGIGEGVITTAIISYLLRTRSDLLLATEDQRGRREVATAPQRM